MPDSHNFPEGLQEAVLEAALMELGGERLDDSGFEGEAPADLDAEPLEGDPQ
jgi:hypothetical protein